MGIPTRVTSPPQITDLTAYDAYRSPREYSTGDLIEATSTLVQEGSPVTSVMMKILQESPNHASELSRAFEEHTKRETKLKKMIDVMTARLASSESGIKNATPEPRERVVGFETPTPETEPPTAQRQPSLISDPYRILAATMHSY